MVTCTEEETHIPAAQYAMPYGTHGGLRVFYTNITLWSAGVLAAVPPAAAQLTAGTIRAAQNHA
jgi:hypothetical protein